MGKTVKATYRNGRVGKNGVYSANHSVKHENRTNADKARTADNITYIFHGDSIQRVQESIDGRALELERYEELFGTWLEHQHERNAAQYHSERDKTMRQIYEGKKTAPMETILQVGKATDDLSPELVQKIIESFISRECFNHRIQDGKNGAIVPLLAALHKDETSIHLHLRSVFIAVDSHGDLYPSQEKALEALGFERPDPTKKADRYNNRLVSYTTANP